MTWSGQGWHLGSRKTRVSGGEDPHFADFLTLSYSAINCFAIFSATSALAPWNFAPLLSCVVDHNTSPSLFTRRTVARASCLRSFTSVDSPPPIPVPIDRALRELVPPPAPL